jgi:hypothetical protein
MDVFVLPSYREGVFRSVLEAMSSALPMVATNIRGCREAVVNGETGLLVPPRNGTALAEAVSLLLGNPDLARSMGSAGRERAVRLYGQRLVQRRFVESIERALQQKNLEKRFTEVRRVQRFSDLIVSGCALIVLAPLMGAIAAVIRFTLGAARYSCNRELA